MISDAYLKEWFEALRRVPRNTNIDNSMRMVDYEAIKFLVSMAYSEGFEKGDENGYDRGYDAGYEAAY